MNAMADSNKPMAGGNSGALPQQGGVPRRERFIPITQSLLMDKLVADEARDPAPTGGGSSAEVFYLLSAWRHLTYQQLLGKLKNSYLPFSPDNDTKRQSSFTPERLEAFEAELNQSLRVLLEQANYVEITSDELQALLKKTSPHGLELKVDLQEFDRALLFARGHDVQIVENWSFEHYIPKKQRLEVPIFKRLFLMLKLKSIDQRTKEIMVERKVSEKRARRIADKQRRGLPEDPKGAYVYLRLFKDIPQADLEMMFPNTQIKLRLFDKVKLSITAGGGTVAGIAGAATKGMAAIAAASPVGLAAALFGATGVIFRQVTSVFATRTKYMMMLAQRLFFHSLANNRGVITLLIDRAEEEDIKEDALLYSFLLRHPMPMNELRQGGQLDMLIEEFLNREFDVGVDFDIEDAWKRLHKDGLLGKTSEGLVTVQPPKVACALLEKKWHGALKNLSSGSLDGGAYEADV